MSEKPLISIVIPFFNRGKLVVRAIESALKQTYTPTEIIVVDDGSTDASYAEISSIKASNLSIIQHDNNKGANAARNTGLKKASGEWVSFLDSDDTWEPDKLAVMMDAIDGFRDSCDVVYCGMHMIEGKKKSTYPVYTGEDIYNALLRKNVLGSTSVPLIRKKILDEINGFDENLKSGQDWDLWLRIASKKYSFFPVDEPLVNYTVPSSDNHISGSLTSFIEGREYFIKKHRNKYIPVHSGKLARIYCDTAFLLLKRFDRPQHALSWFFDALKLNPFSLKPWKGLIATVLPKKILRKLP